MHLSVVIYLMFGISASVHASSIGDAAEAGLQVAGLGESGKSNKTAAAETKTTIKGTGGMTVKGTGGMTVKGTGGMTIQGTGGQKPSTSKAKANANATTIHPQIVTASGAVTSGPAQSAKGISLSSTLTSTKASINSATLTTPAILMTGTGSPNAATTNGANATMPEAETSASNSTTARATFKGGAQQMRTSLTGSMIGFLAVLFL